jgi:hypothetical protein
MKKQDRKGSSDARVTVEAPAYGSRVMVNGRPGTVDNPGFSVSTVILDSGETVKVPHAEVVAAG